MKKKKRELICAVHEEIGELAGQILAIPGEELPAKYRREIRTTMERIRKLADEAMRSGEAMEARLYEYRTAIEDLGFERYKEEE